MKIAIKPALACFCLFLVPVLTGPALAVDCSAAAIPQLPHTRVVSAALNTTGIYTEAARGARAPIIYSGLPSFCLVKLVSSPTQKSHIGIEVWLPAAQMWSQRLHMVGNGAYGSNIYYAQLAQRIRAGDAGVATDTGHEGGQLTFGKDNTDAIIDWGGGRAVHEGIVAAKQLVNWYYGRPQAHAYFSGSSTGGHQALMAAQRYPEDFDGIIAGAPGNNRANLNLQFLWEFLANHPKGDNQHQIVPDEKLAMVNAAILKKCDDVDGVRDGVLGDPRACPFELDSIKCASDDKPDCLTAPQIATLQSIYRGPRDARTGRQIFPGFPLGAEGLAGDPAHPGWSDFWSNSDDNKPNEPQRADFFRYWVFHDPNWNWWNFNWASDVDTVNHVMGPVIDAVDPDLSRFRAHGGKLIMFIGWEDPVGSAYEAVDYFNSVVALGKGKTVAEKRADTEKFLRFYMVPGMGHTAGGPGATNFSSATRASMPPVADSQHDMGLALYDWVEKGIAPGALIATHYSQGSGPTGTVAFQRPICLWPAIAHYKGGDNTKASSFVCAAAGANLPR